MAIQTPYEHIVVDASNVPTIAGTTLKVIELILEQTAYGWSAEELLFQHPYLTLGQIHSALAYYWDHKETLDEDIARRLAAVDHYKTNAANSPLVERVKGQRQGK